jgi:hypothetical protein
LRHISNKFDWYYELKPYSIQALGFVGIALKMTLNLQGFYNFLAFASATTLLGLGTYIVKLRKDYRKKSIMTM